MLQVPYRKASLLAAPATIHPKEYYYIASMSFIGNEGEVNKPPSGLSFSLDVDSMGMAYVTSFRLTRQQAVSRVPILLISEIPLKGVTSLCRAAE